MRLGIVIRMV